MKIIPTLIVALLGMAILAPDSSARSLSKKGSGGFSSKGKSGGSSRVSSSRSSSSSKRSSFTGSRVERPKAKPAPRPASKPAARPTPKPAARPATKPAPRPSIKKPESRPSIPDRRPSIPDKRPSTPDRRPSIPDKRPSLERPSKDRPATLPGMVSYPNRPDKGKAKLPGMGDRKGDGINIDRDRRDVNIGQVNIGRKNVGLSRPGNLTSKNRKWDDKKWGGKNSVWGNNINIGNDVNIKIDAKFKNNNNFAYRPNCWGGRPWWGASNHHHWHHGHWSYGWNSHYYHRHWYYNDNDFAKGFMWGIAVWSLGNMVYDMGYHSYSNPYPAPPVQNTYITYNQPISVAAAANPPGDEEAVALAETKSEEALERSRLAFKVGDYTAASKAVDEALGYTPEDVTLHEFRALVFFALGKYSESAGVLNPVLASGPGWGWDTMIAFYSSPSAYDAQLRKLEAYTKSAPDKADAHFVLGYHYLVADHLEEANQQFAKTAELQPSDTIASQLRDLTGDSIPDQGSAPTEPVERPDPVPSEKLVGTWVSDLGQGGTVTFAMTESGDFSWDFKSTDSESELKGTYGLDDQGLLVLTTDDTQMISVIDLKSEGNLHFALVGAPDGDPGLDFVKKS